MIVGKVVIVTGGAGWIGKEFIKSIAKNNGIAIIADINVEISERVKNSINQELNSENVDQVLLDITSKDSVNIMIDNIVSKYGKIDAIVNNAYPRNHNYGNSFFDVEYSDFVDNLGLNLGGYFNVSQQLAVFFKKQGFGNIINISSIYGVVAPKFEIYKDEEFTMPVEYAVIKSGLIHLTKFMAKLLKGTQIRVNCLSPGGVINNQPESFKAKYNQTCLNKGLLNQEDLIGSLLFLLSDNSKYINGQNLIVDDGFTL